MAWNHRSRVVAMAVALQVGGAGAFVQPNTTTDLMAVSAPTNQTSIISADDPTATGAVWESRRIYLGQQSTLGATYPLRGPGGAGPPAANAWPLGRVLQAGGWTEIVKNATTNAVLVAGSTTTSLKLAATESAVDDFLIGYPVQQANIGAGFRQTTLIRDYTGATNVADLAETLGVAPNAGAAYVIPKCLVYQLGTLTTPPPLLSISIWRDKKRYDYMDWSPSSIAINIPVSNEANTSFPDVTFTGRGTAVAEVDDVTPVMPSGILSVSVPPARDGKFYLDKVKLGHQNLSFTEAATLAAASNQNQAAGQDGFDIISGTRTTALDINQMNVSDFNLKSRVDAQTVLPILSMWGNGSGNNFGFIEPNVVLDPLNPGDRNGYVNLTGNASTVDVDKSAAFAIWW